MKFLNYFKPQIVQLNNGKFAVRRRNFVGMQIFFDKEANFAWTRPEHVMKYCLLDNYAQAEELLSTIQLKVVKVYG